MTTDLSGFTKPLTTKALEKYLGQNSVEMGVLNNAPRYPDGTPMQLVANLNEYGGDNDNPPARFWLLKSGRRVEAPFRKKLVDILKLPQGQRREPLNELARQTITAIKNGLESNAIGLLANAESTKAKKGGNSPMIDTQHLVRGLDYRITTK